MTGDTAAAARHAALVEDAFARGQAALAAGDTPEAVRWLDRARRLTGGEGSATLSLASALIGQDTPRAATLFAAVLAKADVREAWLGLATARLSLGEAEAARTALAGALRNHAPHPGIGGIALQVARLTGAPGWCGITGAGEVLACPVHSSLVETRVDGRLVRGGVLPPTWTRASEAAVTIEGRHLIGSPIALRAISRLDGHVEPWKDGLRGWAWHPGDPDTDPRLSFGTGGGMRDIVASTPVEGIAGLPPLARPRGFSIARRDLPPGDAPVPVRGRDGWDLPGSPVPRTPPRRKQDARSGVPEAPEHAAAASTAKARRRNDLEQWRAGAEAGSAVIFVTHDDGGGVERQIAAAVAARRAQGHRAVVLRQTRPPGCVTVDDGEQGDPLRPRFALPRETASLTRFLRGLNPVLVELHHFLNHDPAVFQAVRALGVPYTVHVHDFAWYCPRIALMGKGDRYCGEPEPAVCDACVAATGTYLHEDIPVAALLARSRTILAGAAAIVAPSADTAGRMARHFPGLAIRAVPHEDDDAVEEPPPIAPSDGTALICVAGAIGPHKGFHVLLACARDARRRGLDLSFVVVGTTIDDRKLIDTGRVFVTGRYDPEEAVDLIRAQNAALAFLPSISPETWCLTLTELWRAGLRAAAFDIGAPADRIRRTGRGFLLPLGMRAHAINDALSDAARGRSRLPVPAASGYKPSHSHNPE